MTTPQGQLSILFLKITDLLLLLLGLLATVVVNYTGHSGMNLFVFLIDFFSTRIKISNAVLGGSLLLIWHVFFNLQGLYRSHRLRILREELKQVAKAAFLCAAVLLFAAQLGSWQTMHLWEIFCFFAFAVLFCGGIRFASRLFLRHLRRRGRYLKTLLIVGGGARGKQFARLLAGRKDLGYRLLGFVDSDPAYRNRDFDGASWLGGFEDLADIVAREAIDDVAVALPIKSRYKEIETVIALLEEQGIAIHLLSDFFSASASAVSVFGIRGRTAFIFSQCAAV